MFNKLALEQMWSFKCIQKYEKMLAWILLKSDLDVKQTGLWTKARTSYSFRCVQVYNNCCYEFGHTFWVFLNMT